MRYRLPWPNVAAAVCLAVPAVLCGAQEAREHMEPVVEKQALPAEVPVPPNMAQYARTTASSEFLPRFPSWRATDGTGIIVAGGTRENCWASAPDSPTAGQWLQLTFDRPEPIGTVLVWYRTILGHHRFVPKTVTVQVSDDGAVWRDVVSRSTNVPKSQALPDRAPREYACHARATALRLLFEDGAQPDERLDVLEVVEIILPPPPDWTPPVVAGADAVEVRGGATLPLVLDGEQSLEVRERTVDGRAYLVYGAGEPVVRLPHGPIGTQPEIVLPTFPPAHFSEMLAADEDIWGERVLSDPRDPCFETVSGFTYPYKFPYCHAGTPEGSQEVAVAWDGSLSQNENGFYMRFGLDGRRIPKEKAYSVYRGLLDGWLPAPVMVYVDRDRRIGWEQTIVCEELGGRHYTYVRMCLRNWGPRTATTELCLFPFVHQKRDTPDRITPANLRIAGNLAYVGPGLTRVGFHLSTPPAVAENRLFYNVTLGPGERWQLVVKLNGYHAVGGDGRAFLEKVVPRSMFAAVRDQKLAWDQLQGSGMRLECPEAQLNDIVKATIARTFIDIDGDVVKGGAFDSYDIHYPLLTMRIVRFCQDWGFMEQGEKYLRYLLRQPLNPPDGSSKSLFPERGTSPVYDGGYFLQVLARQYLYTGDQAFFLDSMPAVTRTLEWLQAKRRTSRAQEAPGSPGYGLIKGRTTGDLSHASYAYCNDAPCWRGLVEMAAAFAQHSERTGDEAFAERAHALRAEAESYRQDILSSIKKGVLHDCEPPFVPIIVGTAEPYRNMHLNSLVSYANFRMYNHLLDAGILDDDMTGWVLDYRRRKGGEILGMIRWGDMVDNFLCEDVIWEKLRQERIREVLLNLYAYVTYDFVPGVWTGYEEFCLDPMVGQDPPGRSNLNHAWWPRWRDCVTHGYEQTRVAANVPMLVRFLLLQAERDRARVWIGRAIPRHWLGEGMETLLERAPTRYGSFDVRYVSAIESAGTITVRIMPPQETAVELRVRVRAPLGYTLRRAEVNGRGHSDVDLGSGTVRIPQTTPGKEMAVTTHWELTP